MGFGYPWIGDLVDGGGAVEVRREKVEEKSIGLSREEEEERMDGGEMRWPCI